VSCAAIEETVVAVPLLVPVLDPEEDDVAEDVVSAKAVGSYATSTKRASDKPFISHNVPHLPRLTSACKLF
jgi:hypothetical protein